MAELRCYARILKVRSVQTFNRRTLALFFELASETASSPAPGGGQREGGVEQRASRVAGGGRWSGECCAG
jgi:hypothetical protein